MSFLCKRGWFLGFIGQSIFLYEINEIDIMWSILQGRVDREMVLATNNCFCPQRSCLSPRSNHGDVDEELYTKQLRGFALLDQEYLLC
jgi:hypothetical protein